jgi:hypothetical protein
LDFEVTQHAPTGYMTIGDAVRLVGLPQKEFFTRYIATRRLRTWGEDKEVGKYILLIELEALMEQPLSITYAHYLTPGKPFE